MKFITVALVIQLLIFTCCNHLCQVSCTSVNDCCLPKIQNERPPCSLILKVFASAPYDRESLQQACENRMHANLTYIQ